MGLSEADQALLDGLAQRLAEQAPAPLWMVRAYVWAVHTRRDPVRAVGAAHYGAGYPLYEGDPTWLDEERRAWSRTAHAVEVARACAAARLNIPLGELAA